MDLRVMRVVDLLVDAGRLIDVARDAGEVVLHTAGGSEIILSDLGAVMMMTKCFNVGIERATIEAVGASPNDFDHSVRALIELEERTGR